MDDPLRLLPPIRRARGARLYAADGGRILDLWLDDGRGILGELDRLARTQAANAADKGLLRPYPGLYEARFAKAVKAAWPGVEVVKVFASEERAMAAAARVLGGPCELSDPALSAGEDAPISERPETGRRALAIARPFLDLPDGIELALPRLPCPRPFSPWCLAARSRTAMALDAEPGDLVPAQALFAAARGLFSLEAAAKDGFGEEYWRRLDRRLGGFFRRRGPYLTAKIEPAEYGAFFAAALSGGTLLSPRPYAPSTLAPGIDDGELLRLAKALSAR